MHFNFLGGPNTQNGPQEPAKPTSIYVGKFDDVAAELGTHECYRHKYILVPYGDVDFTPEQAGTKKALTGLIAEYKQQFPGIRVIWL